MSKIKLTCEGCQEIYQMDRTPEIPKKAVAMYCNWCPKCEDKAEDYYQEWYDEDEGGSDDKQPLPDPTQRDLFPLYPNEKEVKVIDIRRDTYKKILDRN